MAENNEAANRSQAELATEDNGAIIGEKILEDAISLADTVVNKTYLEWLNRLEVVACPDTLRDTKLNDIARFFRVERFVSEKNENNRDKLISVFHAVASCDGSVLVLVQSDGIKTDYYFGTRVLTQDSLDKLDNSVEALEKTLKGNFPGTKVVSVRGGDELNNLLNNLFSNLKFDGKQEKQICTVTGVAGLRSKEESREKLFVQGMEKLIDSMRGEKYSLLLIADPVDSTQMKRMKQGYENIYSELVPYSESELNIGEGESTSVSETVSKGVSKSIGKSVANTLSYTKGSFNSHSHTTSDSVSVGVSVKIKGIGASANYSHSTSDTDTHGTSQSETRGKTTSDTDTDTESEQTAKTGARALNTSRGIQFKQENKTIKKLMEKIDIQLDRLTLAGDVGMWNCSVYCLADVAAVCKITASAYQSLLRGENSSVEMGTITQWTKEKSLAIVPWLEKMHHPLLRLDTDNELTPTSCVSSAELAIHAGMPQSSVGGLPVLEMAPFGREVMFHWENRKTQGAGIQLGKIYHMGNEEELPVTLDKKSLASHTFITGSTGSGKSNTVYKLLSEIKRQEAAFLVIEPAKGEYKNVFGKHDDVSVYGANPSLTPLLRINPFVFPNGNAEAAKNIHILEHLDRLVEIFNVCWPMYAAMPAVLKDAIEVSYEEAGWDLALSTNCHSPVKYPAFVDVSRNIRKIIDSSEYSDENKGNYKGALITRLKSLSNGIYGLIFTADELTNQELFDSNVIVDLSRIGSIETKALVMGILIMKLQEYRMTSGKMNSDLKHVTVLEEAHNLLKRTSTEQISESANLLGKSVEMLANAIAEMRTYGEGFIIADQSPGLLDLSVIRNTNTKIILHLPEKEDRELAGKAASLNDDQIEELAKLQCGVAAVYQNNWLQGVLCKVDEFTDYDKNYRYEKADHTALDKAKDISNFKQLEITDMKNVSLKEIVEKIDFADFKAIKAETIVSRFSNSAEVVDAANLKAKEQKTELRGFYDYLVEHLEPNINDLSSEYRNFILSCIIDEKCKNDITKREIPSIWQRFIEMEVR